MAASKPFHIGLPRTSTQSGRTLYQQAMSGMNAIVSNFKAYCDWMGQEVLPEAMVEALEPTMEKSDYYAPKDTYAMVNSRYNEVRRVRGGNGTRAEAGYNKNGQAPYTIFVHEMPQYYHEAPTQYKFLQRSLDEDTPEMLGRLYTATKKRSGL